MSVLPPPSPSVGRPRARAESYESRRESLRSWLRRRDYGLALDAMAYAEEFHTGLRKDGVTPEFEHQVSIASYVATLTPSLERPEATLATVLVHDVPEDYGVPISEIEGHFGEEVAEATHAMSKIVEGVERDPVDVARGQAESPIASVGKGGDRIHNHSTMVGVFTPSKVASYVAETEEFILPMLREARRLHPAQDLAYQNVRAVLRTQIEMLGRFAWAEE